MSKQDPSPAVSPVSTPLVHIPGRTLTSYLGELRLNAGRPSLRVIAQRAGASHVMVQGLLNGTTSTPRWANIAAVAWAIGCHEDDLLALSKLWRDLFPEIVDYKQPQPDLLELLLDRLDKMIELQQRSADLLETRLEALLEAVLEGSLHNQTAVCTHGTHTPDTSTSGEKTDV
jgi:hypothetical protein